VVWPLLPPLQQLLLLVRLASPSKARTLYDAAGHQELSGVRQLLLLLVVVSATAWGALLLLLWHQPPPLHHVPAPVLQLPPPAELLLSFLFVLLHLVLLLPLLLVWSALQVLQLLMHPRQYSPPQCGLH
jgi:hypothetical protein